jgi:hypothetical protein
MSLILELNQLAGIEIGIFSFEPVNTAGRVHQLLFAGKKRMALGTDFHFDVLFGGTHLKGGTACTGRGGLGILGMDVFFHFSVTPCSRRPLVSGS